MWFEFFIDSLFLSANHFHPPSCSLPLQIIPSWAARQMLFQTTLRFLLAIWNSVRIPAKSNVRVPSIFVGLRFKSTLGADVTAKRTCSSPSNLKKSPARPASSAANSNLFAEISSCRFSQPPNVSIACSLTCSDSSGVC
uniref:Uncharacterized protein n=1 Tax=Sphaerodactylus townsendi TaxID=933632 RepID=A0ACB8EA75_9SAUR